MHEFSIVQSLLDLCEDNAKKNGAKKVLKVSIKVGKLSGVEPELLKTAFETFKLDTICDEALLEMSVQDVVIECRNCNQKSTLMNLEGCCPNCESEDISIIDGNEMYLMSLEME